MTTQNAPFRDGSSFQLIQNGNRAAYGYSDGTGQLRWLLHGEYVPPTYNNGVTSKLEGGPTIWDERDFLREVRETHPNHGGADHPYAPGVLHYTSDDWTYVTCQLEDRASFPGSAGDASTPRPNGDAPVYPDYVLANLAESTTDDKVNRKIDSAVPTVRLQVYPGFYVLSYNPLDPTSIIGYLGVFGGAIVGGVTQTVEWFVMDKSKYGKRQTDPRYVRTGGRKRENKVFGSPWTIESAGAQFSDDNKVYDGLKTQYDLLAATNKALVSVASCNHFPDGRWPVNM